MVQPVNVVTALQKGVFMKIDFSNSAVWKSLEKQAYHGTIEISDFPPVEYKYFSELRQIYYAFKFEGLPKEEAEKAKKHIYRQYQENLQEYQYYSDFVKRWHENIMNAGTYRSEILKTSNLVEKCILAVKCISAMTGDEPFLKTALEQLKGVSK